MTSSKRQGQVQLWDQSGGLRLAVANEINAISQTLKIHVRIIIIRALFVYKEGRAIQNFQNLFEKENLYYSSYEIELELMDATKR